MVFALACNFLLNGSIKDTHDRSSTIRFSIKSIAIWCEQYMCENRRKVELRHLTSIVLIEN